MGTELTQMQSLTAEQTKAQTTNVLAFDENGRPLGMVALPSAVQENAPAGGIVLEEGESSGVHKQGEYPLSLGLPSIEVGEPEIVIQHGGFGVTPFHCSFQIGSLSDIQWLEFTFGDRRVSNSDRNHTQRFTLSEFLSAAHGWRKENPNFHGIQLLLKNLDLGAGAMYDTDIGYRFDENTLSFALEEVHGGQPNTYGFVVDVVIAYKPEVRLPSLTLVRPDPPRDVQIIAEDLSSQARTALQAFYDGVDGVPAPDEVPAEIKDAAAANSKGGYKVYLGHGIWFYSNDAAGQDWSKFGGDKATFSASIATLYTMK